MSVFQSRALLLGLVCALLPASAFAELEVGKSIYATCQACHGENGEGRQELAAPSLSGLSSSYVMRQLMNFRRGLRGVDERDIAGRQMKVIADTLGDEQSLRQVAEYIASLGSIPSPITVQGEAAQGKVYWSLCSSCHGVDGAGNQALGAPPLRGVSDWYLVQQLKNFKDGIRGAHPEDKYGRQMAGFAKMLPDETAMRDLVTYIQTLEPVVEE